MDNSELIKQLKTELDSLLTNRNTREFGEGIRIITGTINRLTGKPEQNLQLKRITVDLKSVYDNQRQYWELRSKAENPGLKVKPEFDESFFKSLDILKTELYTLLDHL